MTCGSLPVMPSEASLTPSLPFACVHHAVQRQHRHPGYYGHWWECSHCGVAMHLTNTVSDRDLLYYVPDEPPIYPKPCTLCTK